jgi:hypothetical protein
VWSAEAVFVCALGLLGRSEQSFPPIDLVARPLAGLSKTVQGYMMPGGRIALVTSTAAFEDARRAMTPCNNIHALREIAGVLVHEEWHVRHGMDEAEAYDAQLTTLASLGAGQGTALYNKVVRAKQAVVAEAKRARTGRMARGGG